MDRRDYYVEYYEVLDRVLSDYVNHLREEKVLAENGEA